MVRREAERERMRDGGRGGNGGETSKGRARIVVERVFVDVKGVADPTHIQS
jgi:hypothetical protein